MSKAKAIEKVNNNKGENNPKPEQVGIGQMALAQIILQAGLRQDVCLLAKLANGCNSFEEFKIALNNMAEEFKKELAETKEKENAQVPPAK